MGICSICRSYVQIIRKKVICIDGWDQTGYINDIAETVPYFKREIEDDNPRLFPIFFAFPEEKIAKDISKEEVLNKIDHFSPMIPANFSWDCEHTQNYFKFDTEAAYYKHYQESYFGYTYKKGGWQVGRYAEIVANNCIPFWTDIERLPKRTWHVIPRDLMIEAKCIRGVHPGTKFTFRPQLNTYIGDTREIYGGDKRGYIDDTFDLDKYYSLLTDIKQELREKMTTVKLAEYILEKSI